VDCCLVFLCLFALKGTRKHDFRSSPIDASYSELFIASTCSSGSVSCELAISGIIFRGNYFAQQPGLAAGGFGLLERVIRRANERAGLDVLEAHGFAQDFEFGEFVGMNVADDGQMLACGL
jgi:hypothetical protein